jgi:hypothetical protein
MFKHSILFRHNDYMILGSYYVNILWYENSTNMTKLIYKNRFRY